MPRIRLLAASAAVLSLVAAVAGCSRAESNDAPAAAADKGPATELRLGYFPNVTHAAALVGLDKGLFTKELGSTKLVPTKFNAGPEAVGALLGGSLDASFIGSGPAINAYAKSNGEAVRLIAGTTSGGAQLVVKPTITKGMEPTPHIAIGPRECAATPWRRWPAGLSACGRRHYGVMSTRGRRSGRPPAPARWPSRSSRCPVAGHPSGRATTRAAVTRDQAMIWA